MEDEMVGTMYQDDDDSSPLITPAFAMNIVGKGKVKEVDINGEKLLVIDPLVVLQLERKITEMQSRIVRLENDLRTANDFLRNAGRTMSQVISELDKKVSYE